MNLRTSATALQRNPDHSRAIELRAGGEEVGLRLKLSRKVRLKRYPVIARVAFEQIRDDLKALLEFAQHDVQQCRLASRPTWRVKACGMPKPPS